MTKKENALEISQKRHIFPYDCRQQKSIGLKVMMIKKISTAFVGCVLLTGSALADVEAGRLALKSGEYKAAIELLTEDLDNTATTFEANWLIGQAYVSSGKSKDAIDYLEAAVKEKPTHVEALYWWGAANGEMAGQASIFSAPGYAKACKKAFEQVLELAPGHIDAREGLIEYLLAAPGFLGGDKERALKEAKKITLQDKSRGMAVEASVYLAQKKIELALTVYGEAIDEFPSNMDALFSRGLLHREMKNFDAALGDFDALVKASAASQKDAGEALIMRGLGQYFFGAVSSKSGLRAEEGMSALEAYLQAGTYDLPLREAYGQYYLATLYLRQGNVVRAKELAASAKQHNKNKDLKRLLKKLRKKLKRA